MCLISNRVTLRTTSGARHELVEGSTLWDSTMAALNRVSGCEHCVVRARNAYSLFTCLIHINSCGHVTCIVNARSKRKIITCNVTRAAVCDKQEVYFTPPAILEH